MAKKAPQKANQKKPAAKSLKEKRQIKRTKRGGPDQGLGL